MHLHPGGQDDLLRRFDAYARENTLIYTTHLPFLVDIREPRRIHVMKEREDRSASVSDDLAASGPDEKLTLQAALGMKAYQQELVAHKNLVVAGSDELFILTALSSLLGTVRQGRLGGRHCDHCGGERAAIVYRATFMVGQGLEVVALFNSDDEGRAAGSRAADQMAPALQGQARSSTVLRATHSARPATWGSRTCSRRKTISGRSTKRTPRALDPRRRQVRCAGRVRNAGHPGCPWIFECRRDIQTGSRRQDDPQGAAGVASNALSVGHRP